MDSEKEEFWWGIYDNYGSSKPLEKSLIGTVFTNKDDAERIYVRVYSGKVRIIKRDPKEMNYKIEKEEKILGYLENNLEAFQIIRSLEHLGEINVMKNLTYFEVNKIIPENKKLKKIPYASFFHKDHANKYLTTIKPKAIIKQTEIIPSNLDSKIILDDKEIAFFCKNGEAKKFNKKFLEGGAILKQVFKK